jgi:hypothetical protein
MRRMTTPFRLARFPCRSAGASTTGAWRAREASQRRPIAEGGVAASVRPLHGILPWFERAPLDFRPAPDIPYHALERTTEQQANWATARKDGSNDAGETGRCGIPGDVLADLWRMWQRRTGRCSSRGGHWLVRRFPGLRVDGADDGLCDWPHFRLSLEPRGLDRAGGRQAFHLGGIGSLHHCPGGRRHRRCRRAVFDRQRQDRVHPENTRSWPDWSPRSFSPISS